MPHTPNTRETAMGWAKSLLSVGGAQNSGQIIYSQKFFPKETKKVNA
jgi:hypothetical protein